MCVSTVLLLIKLFLVLLILLIIILLYGRDFCLMDAVSSLFSLIVEHYI